MRGVVSIPHGWGHDVPGVRMSVAGEHAGVNSNLLSPVEVDVPSGNAVLNGIRVTVAAADREPAARLGAGVGKVFGEIDAHMRSWIERQPLFFTGSAPLDGDGHVNLSPKGPIGSLRVLGPTTVAYLDVVGSGAETIAHLRENGRIVFMLCAFEGPPRIVRIHGRGEVILAGDHRFDDLLARAEFEQPAAAEARRAIVLVEATRISDSCGYGVPLMTYEGERNHADLWAAKRLRTKGPDALVEYQREKNAESLDGLPAVRDLADAALDFSKGCEEEA